MKDIVGQAKDFCADILKESKCKNFPFHNFLHTAEVYENVLKIGLYQGLEFENLEPILLAALFHDTGHAITYKNHEEQSALFAQNFLKNRKYSSDKISVVLNCINATRMPQQPNSTEEKILCDADLYHLGTDKFMSKNKALRKEWSEYLGIDNSDYDWNKSNMVFLKEHKYFTDYGNRILEYGKEKNILILQNRLTTLNNA